MAKKSKDKNRRPVCLLEDCGTRSVTGLRVCRTHSTTAALQQEINRLRAVTPEGVGELMRYPEVRHFVRVVSKLNGGAVDASSNGRLGAAMSVLTEVAGRLERIAHGRPPKPEGPATHCVREECPHPGRAQPADIRYCGYCGHSIPGKGAS